MMFDSVSTMTPFIRNGKVRGLATTGKQRDPILPETADGGRHRQGLQPPKSGSA